MVGLVGNGFKWRLTEGNSAGDFYRNITKSSVVVVAGESDRNLVFSSRLVFSSGLGVAVVAIARCVYA